MLKLRYLYLLLIFVHLLTSFGCNRSDSRKAEKNGKAERILPRFELVVVDDEDLAKAIRREWSASGGEPITIKNMASADISKRQSWTADAIVFPFTWMGELATQRIIQPFERGTNSEQSEEDDRPTLNTGDFFERTRNSEMKWGKRLYGVSLGSPQFVILYRKDLFAQLSLNVPTTWDEYGKLLSTLADRADEVRHILNSNENQPLSAEPIGEGWAAKSFLARSAPYARNRSQYSCLFSIQAFDPRIADTPFVRALDEMRSVHPNAADGTPHSIATDFANGKLAVAITWPEAARQIATDPNANEQSFPIGVSSLPGSWDWYDRTSREWRRRGEENSPHVPLLGIAGRCVSICRRTPDIDRAYDFATWLSDPECSIRTTKHSPDVTISCFSQGANLSSTLPGPFQQAASELADVLKADQSRDLALRVIRVPGHDRYLSSLDAAIRESFAVESSSEEILERVVKEWSAITDEIGRKKQIHAYGESLGINP